MKLFNSILIFFWFSLIAVFGCGSTTTDPAGESTDHIASVTSPTLELLDVSGCKDAPTGIPRISAQADLDCIEYWYSNRNLRMKHVNAAFNCCPVLDFAVYVDGSDIIIEEIEIEGYCLCLCLYDVNYEIQDLDPGAYHLLVIEAYRPEGDPVLEFDMDLVNEPAGNYCVPRSQYPWGSS